MGLEEGLIVYVNNLRKQSEVLPVKDKELPEGSVA